MQHAASNTAPRVALVALDLDGVVWRGERLLPQVAEAVDQVIARGLDVRYVTNNSTAHREEVSRRLAGFGLPAGKERVITSGFVTARWLRERLGGGAAVLVVGEAGLRRELEEEGLRPLAASRGLLAGGARGEVQAAGSRVRAVVVGMDRQFCFDSLAAAQHALQQEDVLFVATNTDSTFPTAEGFLPGAGAMVAAVATAAGRQPVVMGKPGLALAAALARVSGVAPERTLFVGDRLSTDVAMGRAAGMLTALVLSGVTSAEQLREDLGRAPAGSAPDYVLEGLGDLPGLLADLGIH